MNLLRLISLCCLAVLLCASPDACRSEAQLTGAMRTAYFTVHYDPSDPYLAEIAAGIAADELRRIAQDLGYRIERGKPFPLHVYPSHYAFAQGGGMETATSTVGTTSADETIAVDASEVFITMEEVVGHEITHAVVLRLLGRRAAALPTWFSEGLANYESQELSTRDDATVANAASQGELMSLSTLRGGFPKGKSPLAYAESASAVRYLVSRHGKNAPRRLLHEVARTGSFETAMENATGMSIDGFESRWLDHATSKYRGLRIVTILASTISALMAVLAVLAFLARRRRKLEAARTWEEEELQNYANRMDRWSTE